MLKQTAEIKVLLEQNAKPTPKPRTTKPIPAPRKSVKQMVQDYEDNIILPPPEFRDDHKILPPPEFRDDYKILPPPEFMDDYKPVLKPRTKIQETAKALKGYTKSFEISIKNNKDPLEELLNTKKAIEYHIMKMLTSMKGLKFVETLRVTFKKISKR